METYSLLTHCNLLLELQTNFVFLKNTYMIKYDYEWGHSHLMCGIIIQTTYPITTSQI